MKHMRWLFNLKKSSLKYLADSFGWSSRLFFLTLWLPVFAIAFHLELNWGLSAKNTARTLGCCLASRDNGALIVSSALIRACLVEFAAVQSAGLLSCDRFLCSTASWQIFFPSRSLGCTRFRDILASAGLQGMYVLWLDAVWHTSAQRKRPTGAFLPPTADYYTATLCQFGWSLYWASLLLLGGNKRSRPTVFWSL